MSGNEISNILNVSRVVVEVSLWLLPNSNALFLIEAYPIGLCVSKQQFNDSEAAMGIGLAVAITVTWGKMH